MRGTLVLALLGSALVPSCSGGCDHPAEGLPLLVRPIVDPHDAELRLIEGQRFTTDLPSATNPDAAVSSNPHVVREESWLLHGGRASTHFLAVRPGRSLITVVHHGTGAPVTLSLQVAVVCRSADVRMPSAYRWQP